MKQLSILFFLSVLSVSVSAQIGWEAGGWLGVSNYFGDLNTNFDATQPGPAAGVVGRYNFNERLALKFSANYGQVMGDDSDSKNIYEQARNLNFKSDILDGAIQFEFNFLDYVHGSYDQFFSPYLFAGLNAFYFNPTTEYQGQIVELQPLGTEGQFKGEEYSRIDAGLVYGGGVKIALNYRWSINVEISARKLYTDYLDDVSSVYADPGDLENIRGPLAVALADRSIAIPGVNPEDIGRPGRQRGNSANNDSYVFTGISLLYYFGELRCPDISRKR